MSMLMRSLVACLLLLIAGLAPLPVHADGAAPATAQGEVRQPSTNPEIRQWYNQQVSVIPALDKQWIEQGLSAEERAQKAHDIRHAARIKARAFMPNKDEVKLLERRDLEKYGHPDGPTFADLLEKNRKKGLRGDAVYEEIITSSSRTDKGYNERNGVRPPALAP